MCFMIPFGVYSCYRGAPCQHRVPRVYVLCDLHVLCAVADHTARVRLVQLQGHYTLDLSTQSTLNDSYDVRIVNLSNVILDL